jgi:hypothetical protein
MAKLARIPKVQELRALAKFREGLAEARPDDSLGRGASPAALERRPNGAG